MLFYNFFVVGIRKKDLYFADQLFVEEVIKHVVKT